MLFRSKEKLKENLSEEEYESLITGGEDVEYGFKIVDFLADLLS